VEPKPPGWSSEYGAWFRIESVAERYDFRPPYPEEAFDILVSLLGDGPRTVLDAGCGTGDLARRLAPRVDHLDAVDQSAAMLAQARALPGGDAPNVTWIESPIESATLAPSYGLVVAGESIHWFDWESAFPRFAGVLEPNGVLALVYRNWIRAPELAGRLGPIYSSYAAKTDFTRRDVVEELERRGLFVQIGTRTTAPEPWRPTLDELIGCHHSQSGFVLEKMSDPEGFDREVAAVIDELVPVQDDRYELDVVATVTWGRAARLGP
jgi:SAM-dependent methyltransferase